MCRLYYVAQGWKKGVETSHWDVPSTRMDSQNKGKRTMHVLLGDEFLPILNVDVAGERMQHRLTAKVVNGFRIARGVICCILHFDSICGCLVGRCLEVLLHEDLLLSNTA